MEKKEKPGIQSTYLKLLPHFLILYNMWYFNSPFSDFSMHKPCINVYGHVCVYTYKQQ